MEDWTCFLSTHSVVAPYVVQLTKKKKKEMEKQTSLWGKNNAALN